MKVLHLLQSDRFSGAENVVCQIINLLSDENIEFVYCSRDGQIRESLEEKKIKYNFVKNFTLSEIKRVIEEEKPDVIHAHDMRASFYAALCCKNITLISHIHNNNFDSRKLSLKAILYYFAAKKSKHIFWVSKSSFNGYFFHNKFKEKSEVLYNIIDINKLRKQVILDNNIYKYDIVYIGRLTYQKNPQRLLEICKKICEKRTNTKIGIIGTGDMFNDVIDFINSNKNLNIIYLGFMNNPYKVLYNSKVMIMSSRWEGTPMVALESMALGVPIVSTPVDGLQDIIINDYNGYLTNDDEKFVSYVLDILNDNNKYKKLSQNSSIFITEYMNTKKYKESVLKWYRKDS